MLGLGVVRVTDLHLNELRNSLVLVNKMVGLISSMTSTGHSNVQYGNHQLHFLNMATPTASIVEGLRTCGASGTCKANDEANRDMVFNFFERSGKVKDVRFPPTFYPIGVTDQLLKTEENYFRESNEQAAKLVTLFTQHISPNFTTQLRAYVQNDLAPLQGLRLPFITLSNGPLTVANVQATLPLLLSAQKPDGCALDSLHCAIRLTQCKTALAGMSLDSLYLERNYYSVRSLTRAATTHELVDGAVFAVEAAAGKYIRDVLVPKSCFVEAATRSSPLNADGQSALSVAMQKVVDFTRSEIDESLKSSALMSQLRDSNEKLKCENEKLQKKVDGMAHAIQELRDTAVMSEDRASSTDNRVTTLNDELNGLNAHVHRQRECRDLTTTLAEFSGNVLELHRHGCTVLRMRDWCPCNLFIVLRASKEWSTSLIPYRIFFMLINAPAKKKDRLMACNTHIPAVPFE